MGVADLESMFSRTFVMVFMAEFSFRPHTEAAYLGAPLTCGVALFCALSGSHNEVLLGASQGAQQPIFAKKCPVLCQGLVKFRP